MAVTRTSFEHPLRGGMVGLSVDPSMGLRLTLTTDLGNGKVTFFRFDGNQMTKHLGNTVNATCENKLFVLAAIWCLPKVTTVPFATK